MGGRDGDTEIGREGGRGKEGRREGGKEERRKGEKEGQ